MILTSLSPPCVGPGKRPGARSEPQASVVGRESTARGSGRNASARARALCSWRFQPTSTASGGPTMERGPTEPAQPRGPLQPVPRVHWGAIGAACLGAALPIVAIVGVVAAHVLERRVPPPAPTLPAPALP